MKQSCLIFVWRVVLISVLIATPLAAEPAATAAPLAQPIPASTQAFSGCECKDLVSLTFAYRNLDGQHPLVDIVVTGQATPASFEAVADGDSISVVGTGGGGKFGATTRFKLYDSGASTSFLTIDIKTDCSQALWPGQFWKSQTDPAALEILALGAPSGWKTCTLSSIGDRVFEDLDGSGLPDDDAEPGLNGATVELYGGLCPPEPAGLLAAQSTAGNGLYSFDSLPPGYYCVAVDHSNLPPGYSLSTANNPLSVPIESEGVTYAGADFGYARPPAGLAIAKTLAGSAPAFTGQEVAFTIRITNTGATLITDLPLQDLYDPGLLSFVSAMPPADDALNDGVLTWSDLAEGVGRSLAPGQVFEVTTHFRAIAATGAGGLLPTSQPPGRAASSAGETTQALAPLPSAVHVAGCKCEGGKGGLTSLILAYRNPGGHPTVDIVIQANAAPASFSSIHDGDTFTVHGVKAGGEFGASVKFKLYDAGTTTNFQTVEIKTDCSQALWPGQVWGTPKTLEILVVGAQKGWKDCALSTLGDTVWEDVNGNGVQDEGPGFGIDGVALQLYGGLCPPEPAGLLTTQTTAALGRYDFAGLPPGLYCVAVDDAAVLDGYVLTTDNIPLSAPLENQGTDWNEADFGYQLAGTGRIGDRVFYDLDGSGLPDSGYDPGIAGATVTLRQGTCAAPGNLLGAQETADDGSYQFRNLVTGNYCVALDQGTLPASFSSTTGGHARTVLLDDGQIAGEIDFGYRVACAGATANAAVVNGASDDIDNRLPTVESDVCLTILPSAEIGDYVWYDANGNGVQNIGERGLANVTLLLYRDDGDGVFEPVGGDAIVGSALTGANGDYLFPALTPGGYFVDVTDAYNVLLGLAHTAGAQSLEDPSSLLTLGPGSARVDVDFGYVFQPGPGNAILGDSLWYDGNGNGLQDSGEPGIPGRQVCATSTTGGAALCAVSNDNGIYYLEAPAGAYSITVVDPPAGLTPTTPVTLSTAVSAGQYDLALDFGYFDGSVLLGSIGGQIWEDAPVDGAPDGIYDPLVEPGISGVTVNLIRDDDGDGAIDPGEPIIATTSGLDGMYRFAGPPAGSYLVQVSDTNHVLDGYEPTVLGPPSGQDSNREQPYALALAAGENNSTADFGYVQGGGAAAGEASGVLGDLVWLDVNGNGLYEPGLGEAGIPGVTVQLQAAGAAPVEAVASPSGLYRFSDLALGSYALHVTDRFGALAGALPSRLGPNPGQDGNNQAQPYVVLLSEGQSLNLTADFGYVQPATVGGLAWVDTDGDNQPDLGEPTINDVVLEVRSSAGALVDTVISGPGGGFDDGRYRASGLLPGVYVVTAVDWPAVYVPAGLTSRGSGLLRSGQSNLAVNFAFGATTAVDVASLTAVRQGRAVIVRWSTLREEGNVGFHVSRATRADGVYRRMTAEPVPSQAHSGLGGSYQWIDRLALPGVVYWYRLTTVPEGQVIGPVAVEQFRTRLFLPVLVRGR